MPRLARKVLGPLGQGALLGPKVLDLEAQRKRQAPRALAHLLPRALGHDSQVRRQAPEAQVLAAWVILRALAFEVLPLAPEAQVLAALPLASL